eukprot:9437547-Alexandrium_andersonii.AAC.1
MRARRGPKNRAARAVRVFGRPSSRTPAALRGSQPWAVRASGRAGGSVPPTVRTTPESLRPLVVESSQGPDLTPLQEGGAVQAQVRGLRPRAGCGGLRGSRFRDAGAAAGEPE